MELHNSCPYNYDYINTLPVNSFKVILQNFFAENPPIAPPAPERYSTTQEQIKLQTITKSKVLHLKNVSNLTAPSNRFTDINLTTADYDFASHLPPQTQSETTKSIIRRFKDTHQIDLDYNYQASKVFSILLKSGFIVHSHPTYRRKNFKK